MTVRPSITARVGWLSAATCCLCLSPFAAASGARAAAFEDATAELLGETGAWSNKVELADINGDGRIDILVANGGDYNSAGAPVLSGAYVQRGDGTFEDKSATVFLDQAGFTRALKARDVDGDGDLDIVMASTYQTPARVLLGDGRGTFTEAADVPSEPMSAGDVELGDCDNDGDLDALFADWGDGDPFEVKGRPRLWLNVDGAGAFVDETEARMPTSRTGFSWDAEWLDADDDGDLDAVVSCKVCRDGGLYLENLGDCTFLDRSGLMLGRGNNYDFEPSDVDGDGDLDMVTINDGENLAERLLINELHGPARAWVDVTEEQWPAGAASNDDDNAAMFLDMDSDGDSDILIGSLSGDDRWYVNDGAGTFGLGGLLTDGAFTPGTLGIAAGDIDGDDKPDLVMCQGEAAEPEKIYRGVDVAADTVPPHIGALRIFGSYVLVRVHDGKTPVAEHDFASLELFVDGQALPLRWVGEQLWRAELPANADAVSVCALDRAGNGACSDPLKLQPAVPPDDGLHSCASSTAPAAALALALLLSLTKGGTTKRSNRRTS